MVRNIRVIMSLLVILSLVLIPVGQAFASSESTQPQGETNYEEYKNLVNELDKYVKVENNEFVLELDSKDLESIGISQDEYDQIQEDIAVSNNYIEDNKWTINPDLKGVLLNQNISVRGGVNQTLWTWYGWDMYWDSDTTAEVIDKLSWGSPALSIGALIALLVPGANAIVAAVAILGEIAIGIGIAALQDADDGNGVIVHLYQPDHGIINSSKIPFWVTSQ